MFAMLTINEWWDVLNTAQRVFWLISILFSILFVVQFGLSLVGLGADDVDTDAGTDFDGDHGHAHHFGFDKAFSIFSIRSIIAFFTFFGWTGVYLLATGLATGVVILISTLSGAAAMFVVGYMIFKFAQLEKSTTVNMRNALDSTGEVYLSIPENLSGKGKIHVMIDGSLHEYDAETQGPRISTGANVRVVDILEDDVFLVESLEEIQVLNQVQSITK